MEFEKKKALSKEKDIFCELGERKANIHSVEERMRFCWGRRELGWGIARWETSALFGEIRREGGAGRDAREQGRNGATVQQKSLSMGVAPETFFEGRGGGKLLLGSRRFFNVLGSCSVFSQKMRGTQFLGTAEHGERVVREGCDVDLRSKEREGVFCRPSLATNSSAF